MQPDWQAFLGRRGAVFQGSAVQRFAAPAAKQSDVDGQIVDLSHLGLLSVRGEEAEDFLQGQLSNDTRALGAGATQLTSYSTPQGRMLAIMRAFRHGDALQFLLPQELVASLRTRLSRYVLRARVAIGSDDAELGRIALLGDTAAGVLAELSLSAPCAGSVACDGPLCVLNVTSIEPCYLIVAPYPQLMRVWQLAEKQMRPAGEVAWRRLLIDAGIPTVYAATSESFVPQMTNLELLGGVNFDKGCYTGQEIIARAQYLGRIKRRMFRFSCAGDTLPRPGEPLALTDGGDAGTVVDAVAAGPGARLLAVVRTDVLTQTLHHRDADGPVLQPMSLPYDVPVPEPAA